MTEGLFLNLKISNHFKKGGGNCSSGKFLNDEKIIFKITKKNRSEITNIRHKKRKRQVAQGNKSRTPLRRKGYSLSRFDDRRGVKIFSVFLEA